MIERRLVVRLGLAPLISWGVSYHLTGGFGEEMSADPGWGRDVVYGGFALALAIMGATSPLAGRLIDRHGGRTIMAIGLALCLSAAVAVVTIAAATLLKLWFRG